MRAPAFWYQPSSILGLLLAPLGWLYDAIGKFLRGRITPEKISIPVVCVGNITLGGAGKTPVVAELARRLSASGIEVHILSRGYGGKAQGPLRVDPSHNAREVGDEPLLLAKTAPVWVAKNKLAGAKAAALAGAQIVILDDGMQNPSLHKDFTFLVMEGAAPLGNGRVFPAGPLRETPADGLAHATAVIWMGAATPPLEIARTRKPFLRCVVKTICGSELRGRKVFAFCGIAMPEKFFTGLRAEGAEIASTESFADHHPYSRGDLENLLEKATKLGAIPVTTEKDAARIPPDLLARLTLCDLRLIWQDEPAFEKCLREIHGLIRRH